MNNSPLVSIVINNFNYGRFLSRAVDSALNQTYGSIEVIVVDDGSTDDSRSILRAYGDRIAVIFQENSGQAKAFNMGIAATRGTYTLLLDSDDYLLPATVATCVACFSEGYSRLYYRLRTIDEAGALLDENGLASHFTPFDGDIFEAIRNGAQPFFSVPTSGNFFASDKLRSILPIPEEDFRICADSFILVRTGLRGPVKSIDEVLGAYRIHGRNNFASRVFRYSDRKRVNIHIQNYYRVRSLVVDACRSSGFRYDFLREESSAFLTQCLCTGHCLGIANQFMVGWNFFSLLKLVGRFLRRGNAPVHKRLFLSSYLSVLLVLPTSASRFLIQGRDLLGDWRAVTRRTPQVIPASTEPSRS